MGHKHTICYRMHMCHTIHTGFHCREKQSTVLKKVIFYSCPSIALLLILHYSADLHLLRAQDKWINIFIFPFFVLSRHPNLMLNAALSTLLEILLRQFSQVILVFFVLLFSRKESYYPLSYRKPTAMLKLSTFFKMGLLNLKCSGLNTQHFYKTSALMHAQYISKADLGLKLHTES